MTIDSGGRQQKFFAGAGLAMITVLIWSGNYVVARGIAKQLPPVSLAFYRWSLASLVLLPFSIKGFLKEWKTLVQHKAYLFWTALTGVTIFNTFIYLGGRHTSAINLALIGTTAAPVFVTVLAGLFLKEKVTRERITGMAICVMGILVLLSQGSFQRLANFHFGEGDVLVLVSAISFSIYSTLVRRKPAAISPLIFLFTVFFLGTLMLFPAYLYELKKEPAVQWTPAMTYIILYLGIGNSIIAFFCWNASIQKLGAASTALFANLIPVFSTIEAVLFLDESITIIHLYSGLLIIAGVVIANLKTRRA